MENKIDKIFEEFNEKPGCVVAVYDKDKTIFQKGYGYANLDYDIKNSPETVFDLASNSKQFTAACISLLESEGKLNLDDEIQKYIPEFPNFSEGKITVSHLLYHTSGLNDYVDLLILAAIPFSNHFTEEDCLLLLKRQKSLNFEPGTKHLYCNSGYVLLAIIIERISGLSIAEFASINIFRPLRMNNTFYHNDSSKIIKNRAIGYAKKGNEYQIKHSFNCECCGDGQVYTTAKDFYFWNENLRKNKIGYDNFVENILKKGVLNNGESINYAMGLIHGSHKGLNYVSHNGSSEGFNSQYIHFLDENISVLVMSNNGNCDAYSYGIQVAELYLADKLKYNPKADKEIELPNKQEIEFTKDELEKFCGCYWNDEYNGIRKIYLKDDSLQFHRSENNVTSLIQITQSRFKMSDSHNGFIEFGINTKNQRTLTLVNWNALELIEYEPVHYSREELNTFCGIYYCQDLDVNYELRLIDDTIYIYIKDKKTCTIHEVMENLFLRSDNGRLVFEKDKADNVIGFTLETYRVKNLKFSKI